MSLNKVNKNKFMCGVREEDYLKCSTDIFDSCCSRPHAIIGILLAFKQSLLARLIGTSLKWSLTYELTGATSSPFSTSRAFASTCFRVRLKFAKENILAYSWGSDSWNKQTRISRKVYLKGTYIHLNLKHYHRIPFRIPEWLQCSIFGETLFSRDI